jgi:nucleoside-diphosphate-sugar epimerase
MKIGIIGYKGFVGSAIFAQFWAKYSSNVFGISRENYGEAPREYDIVINANGNPKKRLGDSDPKLDFDMNVVSTQKSLFDFKFKRYVFISTVEVYNSHDDPELNKEDQEIEEEYISNYGFDKYMAEKIVRRYAKNHLIFRLGGMVGPNLKKNMVYDIINLGKTFVSPLSKFQYIDTPSVARAIEDVIDQGIENEMFNICGDDTISGEEVADMAGKSLDMNLYEQPKENYNVNISKICRFTTVPKSRDAVRKYIEFIKTGSWGKA